ncbi:MAG: hypothetical protein AAF747_04865 [Planctomycetota bacterium]
MSEPSSNRSASVAARGSAALAFTLLLAAGCSEDPTQRALEDAERRMSAMAVPGVLATETAESEFSQVKQSIGGVSGDGSQAQQAAASLISSAADRGLARPAAEEASRIERELTIQLADAEAALAAWINAMASADAAEGFDPTPVLADIARRRADREQEAAEARATKADLDGQIASLRSEAQADFDRASELRAQAAELRFTASTASAREGLPLVEQARTIGREADALELTARELTTQADLLEPQSNEAQVTLDKLAAQLAALDATRASVETRMRRLDAEAAEARADAAEAAAAFDRLIGDGDGVMGRRSGELADAIDDASSKLSAAVRAARGASGADRSSIAGDVSTSSQVLGQLLASNALGWQDTAALLRRAAETMGGLPNASMYRSLADAADEAAASAATAASQAYGDAIQQLGNIRARDAAAERIEALIERLEAARAKLSDEQLQDGEGS